MCAVALAGWPFGAAQPTSAQPTVIFFNDRTAFESRLVSFSRTDFEGIVADDSVAVFLGGMTNIGGVVFDAPTLGVAGREADVSGAPFGSALMFGEGPITIDLAGQGGVTAIGGWFGDTDGTQLVTLTLLGIGGVLDTKAVLGGDMGSGSGETFYGWIVKDGRALSLVHEATVGSTVALDDLAYGSAGPLRDASIAMYETVSGQPDFNSCQATTTFFPGAFGIVEFEIWAELGNLGGITGAEFRVVGGESFPGWTIIQSKNPDAISIGNPMIPVSGTHRVNLAFTNCQQADRVLLYKITYLTNSAISDIPGDTVLQVMAGSPPSSPEFDCPLVTRCDENFTITCIPGSMFVINPNQIPCAISDIPSDADPNSPVLERTWTLIKSLYR